VTEKIVKCPINTCTTLRNDDVIVTSLQMLFSQEEKRHINATLLMNILVRSMLCSKRVIEELHLTSEPVEWILGETLEFILSLLCAPPPQIRRI